MGAAEPLPADRRVHTSPMDLARVMAANRGVASLRNLAEVGIDRAEVVQAVRAEQLRRVRRGWYATEYADQAVLSAVSAGGVLSCASALQAHGVWVPPLSRVHLRVRAGTSVRTGTSTNGACRQFARREPERGSVDAVPIALRHAIRCLDDEGIVVVCDSLLNLGLMTRTEIAGQYVGAPIRVRQLLARLDRAESGTETMVRLRLRNRGIRVTPQVWIRGVGRVDLLVGDRLIIEVDGREYHAGSAQFEADRARDRHATQLGYLVVRLTYRQVLYDWPDVVEDILAVVRRRDHRKVLGIRT